MKLKKAEFIAPVSSRGSMVQSIAYNPVIGDEIHLLDNGFVEVRPNPTAKKDAFLVPLSNIRSLVVLDVEFEEARKAEQLASAEKAKAAQVKAKEIKQDALRGVEKLVKGKDGAIKSVLT